MVETNLYIKGGQVRPLGLDRQQQRRITHFIRGLRRLEPKLFRALNRYYFSRDIFAICQNTALILSRVLSSRFNLPVSRTLPPGTDHIEIAIGIYAPPDLAASFHQTYLKVFMAGKVFYVDPTFQYLNKKGISILVRVYPAETFSQNLSREFGIELYSPDHRAYGQRNILAYQFKEVDDRRKYVELSLDILHFPKLIAGRDGMQIGFEVDEWRRMNAVIRELEPRAALPPLEDEVREVETKFGSAALLQILPERLFNHEDE